MSISALKIGFTTIVSNKTFLLVVLSSVSIPFFRRFTYYRSIIENMPGEAVARQASQARQQASLTPRRL